MFEIRKCVRFFRVQGLTHLFAIYRCWYWICVWITHHWLCQESLSQATAVLIRHPGLCPVRGHGSFLSYDGFPAPLRLLSHESSIKKIPIVLVRHCRDSNLQAYLPRGGCFWYAVQSMISFREPEICCCDGGNDGATSERSTGLYTNI